MKLLKLSLPLTFVSTLASADSLLQFDFTAGPGAAQLGATLGIAKSAWLFFTLLAVAKVGILGDPLGKKSIGGAVMRALVILALLTFYGRIFGFVQQSLSGIADRVAPADTWQKLQNASFKMLNAKVDEHVSTAMQRSGPSLSGTVDDLLGLSDTFGGVVFDAIIRIFAIVGQAALWIVGTFSHVLAGVLFVLGPLCLVVSVPAGVSVGASWFKAFCSVLAWPVICALMVSFLVAFGLQALEAQADFEYVKSYQAIALSGLMLAVAVSTPMVASALVGAGFAPIGAGVATLTAAGSNALGVLAAAVEGARTGMQNATTGLGGALGNAGEVLAGLPRTVADAPAALTASTMATAAAAEVPRNMEIAFDMQLTDALKELKREAAEVPELGGDKNLDKAFEALQREEQEFERLFEGALEKEGQ